MKIVERILPLTDSLRIKKFLSAITKISYRPNILIWILDYIRISDMFLSFFRYVDITVNECYVRDVDVAQDILLQNFIEEIGDPDRGNILAFKK